ncbi:asparagine synthase (glutamine-hydrolyzing) [Nocardia sp. CY41]|uniref:asparagine synthase (glutamine-hydrolyzing) n=1 Tax=Nocardia sp. CY41 TaxID=2608686 RepID=UPI00135A8A04|nr:asparagine synthase (glutamine-hydrolyzing) [Nocardia sp. CY41]
MCRIHGHLGGDPVDRTTLFAIADAQRHGGPDAATVHLGTGWALGNARLAVQGIETGRQPFRLGDNLFCVYNGEIYNHDQLRSELRSHGYHFTGCCDGDVLLPMYQRYGDRFTSRLSGMYAIAIIDTRNSDPVLKLFIDPAGMKSLYYYRTSDGRGLRFASEIAALQRFPDFPDELDPLAIDRYLGGKAIWGPDTIYTGVHTLPPGAHLTFTATGTLSQHHPPLPPPAPLPADLDVPKAAGVLHDLMSVELTRMLSAQARVCVITSGGLDSSYLTALAARLHGRIATFNVAYTGDWPADERHYATEVAQRYGTRHTQVELDPRQFPDLIGKFVAHLDQPNNAPHSLATFGLFEHIHDAGFKVAVTGDGADELFAGYTRFRAAATDGRVDWHRRYQTTLAAAPAAELQALYTSDYRAALAAGGGLFSDRVGDQLRAAAAANGNRLQALLDYDLRERFPYYILRRVDHLSMAHSVEARIPFLQPPIVTLARSLPPSLKIADGLGKAVVTAAAAPLLPRSVLDRPKQPFTLPIQAMMVPGQPLYDLVGDIVLARKHTAAVFDHRRVANLFERQRHPGGDAVAAELLWSILVLEMWMHTAAARTDSLEGANVGAGLPR